MSSDWQISPLHTVRLHWGTANGHAHECPWCHLPLLTGEKAGFCCGKDGTHLRDVSPLPPLPDEFRAFVNHPQFSTLSRQFNLLFSFASMETTANFPDTPAWAGFLAIEGKVYHRIRPYDEHSSVRWMVYDGFHPSHIPYANTHALVIPPTWIFKMQQALQRLNPFARALLQLSSLPPSLCINAHVVLQESTSAEIAACLSYDNTSAGEITPRHIIIRRVDNAVNIRIPAISRLWEPLAYPLLFPHGTLGWGLIGDTVDVVNDYDVHPTSFDADQVTTQMWFYRARLLRELRFELFGRLVNEYIVDMFTRHLDCRLRYIRDNQPNIREADAALLGTTVALETDNVYLPASFLGSRRWASEQIADSLAIAAQYGPPTFFITMTCNDEWPEITSRLHPGQTFADIPVVVCRVFRQKLALLERHLQSMFSHIGPCVYLIRVVEFQKRGLPHAHILVKYPSACATPSEIDHVISAEVPSDPTDAHLVTSFMLHKHPAPTESLAKYCQRESADGTRTCRFHYPFPQQPFTSINDEGRVTYRRRKPEDVMIVPHCLELIRAFRCHINFEAAGPSQIFQYLFKYIHKGRPPHHTL